MTKKSWFTLFQSSCHDKQNVVVDNTINVMMLALVPTALHNQKCHIPPCFNCAYLMSKMMPWLIELAPHGSNAGTNGITWLRTHVSPSFRSQQPNNCNGAIDNTIDISKICLRYCSDMSRHCLDVSRNIKTCLVIV